MSISIREFEIAMKLFGDRKVPYVLVTDDTVSTIVEGVRFIYSGFGYVICEANKISIELRQKLRQALGKEYPLSYDFECNKVYTVRALLTLIAMLRGTYTKNVVDRLINEIYKELLSCGFLKENKKSKIEGMHSQRMLELYTLLAKYDNLVNPFCDAAIELKEPCEYFNFVILNIDYRKDLSNGRLSLASLENGVKTSFERNSKSYSYDFTSESKDGESGNRTIINFVHMFNYDSDIKHFEEVVTFYKYSVKITGPLGGICVEHLNFSLTSGLVWKTGEIEKAKLVSEKQIETIIKYVKISIESIKQEIISHMMR